MVFLRTCLPAVICMAKRPLRPFKAGRRQDSCVRVPGAHEQLERVCVSMVPNGFVGFGMALLGLLHFADYPI